MSKISELPTTAFPNLQHMLPASYNGETHRLPLAQIKALFAYQAADIGFSGGTVDDELERLDNVKADSSSVQAELLARIDAFGLGLTVSPLAPNDNLNNAVADGWVRVSAATLNTPGGAVKAGSVVLTAAADANNRSQIYFELSADAAAPSIYHRIVKAGVAGSWARLSRASELTAAVNALDTARINADANLQGQIDALETSMASAVRTNVSNNWTVAQSFPGTLTAETRLHVTASGFIAAPAITIGDGDTGFSSTQTNAIDLIGGGSVFFRGGGAANEVAIGNVTGSWDQQAGKLAVFDNSGTATCVMTFGGSVSSGYTVDHYLNDADYQVRISSAARGYRVLNDALSRTLLWVQNNGDFSVPGAGSRTTASAANCFVSTSGAFYRSTSALKYKTDLQPITDEQMDLWLGLDGFTYVGVDDPEGARRFGFAADHAHEVGLNQLVTYDENGEVEGYEYGRDMPVAKAVIKRQIARINELEAQLAAVMERLTALEG